MGLLLIDWPLLDAMDRYGCKITYQAKGGMLQRCCKSRWLSIKPTYFVENAHNLLMMRLYALRHIGQHGGVADQLPNIPHGCRQLAAYLQGQTGIRQASSTFHLAETAIQLPRRDSGRSA